MRRSDAEVKTRLYFCVSRHSALTPNSATLDLEDTMPEIGFIILRDRLLLQKVKKSVEKGNEKLNPVLCWRKKP